jgi:CheY-like chemotaxis protein
MAAARILVVDDDPMVLTYTTRILQARGYEVLPAGHPVKAIELVRASDSPIDLILSDVVMPEMRGTDLARQITQTSPTTAVLFMSGRVEPGELPAEATLIRKPFLPVELIARVEESLVSASEARSQLQKSVRESQLLRQERLDLRHKLQELGDQAEENRRRSTEPLEDRKQPEEPKHGGS